MKLAKRWSLVATATAMAVTVAGCAEKAGPTNTADAQRRNGSGSTTNVTNATNATAGRPVPAWPPTRAQPRLRTLKLFVGQEVITAEIAKSQIEIGTGMMFRADMAEDEGMLFVFRYPQRTSFYMKNTTVPLTAAYIDSDGTILELVELNPLDETPVEAKSDNVQYVLEMKQGWFQRHNITPGMVISAEGGATLRTTFGFRN